MHTGSPRRRLFLTAFVLWVVAATVISVSSTAAAKSKHRRHHHKHKASLAGTWSGSYSGAFSGTFVLKWKQSGSHLNGSIKLSFPRGRYSCTGQVHHGHITFGAVGAGATYKGSVSGRSMSGTYNTGKGGGSWSAHKMS
jgi:hypothetical protein